MDTHTIMPVKRTCVHRFGCGRRSLRYIGRRCDSPIQGLAGCHSVYIWHKCLVQFGKLYALWGAKRSGWQSWHLACVHVCAHLLVSGPPRAARGWTEGVTTASGHHSFTPSKPILENTNLCWFTALHNMNECMACMYEEGPGSHTTHAHTHERTYTMLLL